MGVSQRAGSVLQGCAGVRKGVQVGESLEGQEEVTESRGVGP